MIQPSPLFEERPHSFSEYLISVGFPPEIARVLNPAEYFDAREREWETLFRQVLGEKPAPPDRQFAAELIARARKMNLDAPDRALLLDEIDQSLGSDDERFPCYCGEGLNAGQFETRYLIPGILAAGQPGGIFGSFKTLKTSLTADLLISLASGTPFLGQFPVAEPGRVLFFSGESGLSVLQSLARRICAARGLALESLKNFELCPRLPRLDNPADVRALRRIITKKKPICVAIDPAYLSIRGYDARNLFSMGELLRPLAEIGDATGCTILVVHHCKRAKQSAGAPATLDDVAWSGFAEFAAQWLLLSRRRRFNPETARHELWCGVGGRAGHYSLWALDATEGVPGRPARRQWRTTLRSVTIAEAQSDERTFEEGEERRARRAAATFERQRTKVLEFFKQNPQRVNARYLRDKLGINGVYLVRVLDSLVSEGRLAASELQKAKRTEIIYSLPAVPTTEPAAESA
jgi:hypothetical protein